MEDGLTHLGPEHFVTIEAQFWLARALAAQDDRAKQVQARAIFATLLPFGRPLAQTGEDERFSYGFTCVVGHLESPTSADVKLALKVNQRVLGQPLRPLFRLRNLHAGALVKNQSGDTEGAMAFLREIIESPVAYGWSAIAGDSPFLILRNTEDLLARILLELGDKADAEKVYRDAVTRREDVKSQDKFQIIFAKQRLAEFLLEQSNKEEAHELLGAAQDALRDAPECFDWLRERIQEDLRAAEE